MTTKAWNKQLRKMLSARKITFVRAQNTRIRPALKRARVFCAWTNYDKANTDLELKIADVMEEKDKTIANLQKQLADLREKLNLQEAS